VSVSVQGRIDIHIDDWLGFLRKYAEGAIPDGAEVLYGPITDNGDFVSVEFAADTEVSPLAWLDAPEWIKKREPR